MTARLLFTRFSLPLLLIVCLLNPIRAQDYMFKVIVNKGSNQFRSGSSMEWKAISTGLALKGNDELKTVNNVYLGLVHSSGKTMVFQKMGIFKVFSLESSLQNIKKGLPSKYTDFVIENILTTENETDPGKGMRPRGEDEIHLLIPKIFEVFNREFIVSWNAYDGMDDASYSVEIMDLFNEPLSSVSTNDTLVVVDLNRSEFQGQKLLIIRVYLNTEPKIKSADYTISEISEERKTKLREELDSFSDAIDEGSPVDQIMLAGYFEMNELMVDAAYHYHLAIQLAPELEDVKKLYIAFLRRNGLE